MMRWVFRRAVLVWLKIDTQMLLDGVKARRVHTQHILQVVEPLNQLICHVLTCAIMREIIFGHKFSVGMIEGTAHKAVMPARHVMLRVLLKL